ncbi:ankyrin [Acephala macrosclerotiorum]|nr:ankyrin [Acephala macrosclerotiorum]
MDPLSIVASIIAICQAADRLGGLLSSIQSLVNAPKNVQLLFDEMANLRSAMEDLRSTVGASTGDAKRFDELINKSLIEVDCLQNGVCVSLFKKDRRFQEARVGFDRIAWIRKRKKIEDLKRSLRDGIPAIQLEALSLTLKRQESLLCSLRTIGDEARIFQQTISVPLKILEHSLAQDNGKIPPIHENLSKKTLGCENCHRPDPMALNNCTANLITEDSNANSEVLSMKPFTTTPEMHQPYMRVGAPAGHTPFEFLTQALMAMFLCLFKASFFSASYDSRSTPSLSVVCSSQYMKRVLHLCWHPSPFIFSLSIHCMLAPDAEIFVYIRSGEVENIKNLLIQQRASVDGVMGPYGITTLSLAVLYGRREVYELLLSAGASRVPQRHICSTGTDVCRFWGTYSSLDHAIHASQILDDLVFQSSPTPYARMLSNLASTFCPESTSFTQLHKCVLQLTSETLEELLPLALLDIEETDSLGRTALHLAAYTNHVAAIRLLVKHHADVGIRDYSGKTPLQVAATLGNIAATKEILIAKPNLHSRD